VKTGRALFMSHSKENQVRINGNNWSESKILFTYKIKVKIIKRMLDTTTKQRDHLKQRELDNSASIAFAQF